MAGLGLETDILTEKLNAEPEDSFEVTATEGNKTGAEAAAYALRRQCKRTRNCPEINQTPSFPSFLSISRLFHLHAESLFRQIRAPGGFIRFEETVVDQGA